MSALSSGGPGEVGERLTAERTHPIVTSLLAAILMPVMACIGQGMGWYLGMKRQVIAS